MEQTEFIIKNGRNLEVDGLGSIVHPKWFSTKAEVTAGLSSWFMQPKGFWGTRYELLQHDTVAYEIANSFWGKVTITPLKAAHHFFTINYGKGFKANYRLLDYKGEEVATIISKWQKWKTIYTLTTIDGFTATDEGKLLALLLVRHYRGMQQAAAASAIN